MLTRTRLLLFLLVAVIGCAVLALWPIRTHSNRVVVYSAQDEEFAVQLFGEVEQKTQVQVVTKYDTEANKSVSLALELEQDAARPRCDLHWNNEILSTIRLARKGIYQAYRSPFATDFPVRTKSPDGLWQAFAARARVLIVNTKLVAAAERPTSILHLTDAKWHGRVALAKPQFGTTATHAACLFEVLGSDRARTFFRELKANAVQLVPGNKQVARGVSAGTYAVGITDTDDAILEVLAGKPVVMIFPDSTAGTGPQLGTLFIPNTLAIVKNGPNTAGAKVLYDELLQRERQLASGGGFQFPLRTGVPGPELAGLAGWNTVKRMDVNFERAADLWDEVQAFLREEFAR